MEIPQEITAFWQSGLTGLIPPWERRHLRAWAGAGFGAARVLAVCGVLTLALGGSAGTTYGSAGTTYGSAALFLGLASLIVTGSY